MGGIGKHISTWDASFRAPIAKAVSVKDLPSIKEPRNDLLFALETVKQLLTGTPITATQNIDYQHLRDAFDKEIKLMTRWHNVSDDTCKDVACHNCRALLDKQPYSKAKKTDQLPGITHNIIKPTMPVQVQAALLNYPNRAVSLKNATLADLKETLKEFNDATIFEQVGIKEMSKQAADPSATLLTPTSKESQVNYWTQSFKLVDHPCASALRCLHWLVKSAKKPGMPPQVPSENTKAAFKSDTTTIVEEEKKSHGNIVTYWLTLDFIKQHLYCLGRLADTHKYNKAYIASRCYGHNEFAGYGYSLFDVPKKIDKPIIFLVHIGDYAACELRPNFLDTPNKSGSVLRLYARELPTEQEETLRLLRNDVRQYLDSFEHTQGGEIEPIETEFVTDCPRLSGLFQGGIFACEIIRRLACGTKITKNNPIDVSGISEALLREKNALLARHRFLLTSEEAAVFGKKPDPQTVPDCRYCKVLSDDTKSVGQLLNEFKAIG